MIVDKMEFDDIFRLFQKDIPLLNAKIIEYSKSYGRLVHNSMNRKRLYYTPIKFDGESGLKYTLQFFCRGTDEPEKERLGVFYYVTYINKWGMHAFRLSLLNKSFWHIVHYIPHFFDQYRKRFCKDLSMDKKDVIHQFFINNLKSIAQKKLIPSKKHPNEYWMACNEGLCLCVFPQKEFVQVNTFISWDLARIDQKEFVLRGFEALSDFEFELNLPEEEFHLLYN